MAKIKNEYKEIVRTIPNTDCCFKYLTVDKGLSLSFGKEEMNGLLFILTGKLQLSEPAGPIQIRPAGYFSLFPQGSRWEGNSMQESRLLFFFFNNVDQAWTSTKIRKLLEASADLPERGNTWLPVQPTLDSFLRLIALYTEEKELDRSFYAWKDIELFSLLYAFYAPQELGYMFRPVLKKNLDFKTFVEANYLKVENASELAELAGCSLVTLNRKFREYFNDTAYQWIIKNKTAQIKKRLQTTHNSLTEIAKEFGFYSGSELNRFCQRQFGLSALKLRKQITGQKNGVKSE